MIIPNAGLKSPEARAILVLVRSVSTCTEQYCNCTILGGGANPKLGSTLTLCSAKSVYELLIVLSYILFHSY